MIAIDHKKTRFSLGALAGLLFFGAGFFTWSSAKDRVAQARLNRGEGVEKTVTSAGLSYPLHHVFIRHFKLEQELEVWGRDRGDQEYTLIRTYPVCMSSGTLGPKRRQGDLQVPEGVYKVDRFNPQSQFHLSLGINYPNQSDRKLGDPRRPGGDIFIHGSCVTIGCVPIEDGPIEELYIMALDSKNKSRIPPAVHVFPCRMDKDECKAELDQYIEEKPELKSFWDDLEKIYASFEKNHQLPKTRIDSSGRYLLEGAGS